jgi:peptidoglycan/LPS O-acetylase OafA/YrhL
MSRPTDRRMFYTIDGLRGMAALLVVCRHIIPLHGGQLNFQSSYLAVELFFLFSGFVIAHAYDRRFAEGLGFWEFVKVRFIRLYPIYFLGFAVAVLTIPMARLMGLKTWPLDPGVIIPGLLILPTFARMAAGLLYPFNNPSWTLFFELTANFVYALVVNRLTNRLLAAVVLLSAGFLAWTAFHFHSLDVGYNKLHFVGGFGRVFFSFFAGVAVYRLQNAYPCPVKVSPWILMIAGAALLVARVPRGLDREMYDTACAPLGGVLNQFFQVYGHPKGSAALGIAFIACASVIAWLVEKYYDRPVRKWLTAITRSKTAQAVPAPLAASDPVSSAKTS